MKTLAEFILSVIALPLLIPWYLSEKIFIHLVQPLLFRKYQIAVATKWKPGPWALRAGVVLLAAYLVMTGRDFLQHYGPLPAALKNVKILAFMIYNDAAAAVNTLLHPLNMVLAYAGGADVGTGRMIVALYLLFVPLLFVANIGFNILSGNRSLRRAVKLRDEAVRDVDLVHFAEKAQNDQFFLGIDLNRNGMPFYANRRWLQGHVQVIGAPGAGKTESILQPLWFQHVRRNAPTFVLDGKGVRQNIDRFFTIASSLAQGHEIIYFNPADPERSATYNPLQRGSVAEVKNRLLASVNWRLYPSAQRERLDFHLSLLLRAFRETKSPQTLNELHQCFKSKTHLQKLATKLRQNSPLQHELSEVLQKHDEFLRETAFFSELLREVCHAEYGWLLDSETPELDVLEVYKNRRDCYFSVPLTPGDAAAGFVGQLILADLMAAFQTLAGGAAGSGDGLLVIDDAARFINPGFVELLRISRDLGVCVCYTNQSLAELSHPDLHLSKAFINQLADHTNVTCCFHVGNSDTIEAIMDRMGVGQDSNGLPDTGPAAATTAGKKIIVVDPNFLKHLEVGRCLVHVRQPQVTGILKTGYFKFEELLPFARQADEESAAAS